MEEIIIGRNGDQPFKITAEGVSARHASLTIRDDGRWELKDLDSTNGTYIRDENYQYVRIAVKVIDEDTVIRLGSDDSIRSIQFIAFQLIKTNQDDFSHEFEVLRKKLEASIGKKNSIEKKVTRLSYAPLACSAILMVGTMKMSFDPLALRFLFILPTALSPLINNYGKKRLKELASEMRNDFVCPNPKCRYPLSEIEIRRGQCSKCKCHI